MENVRDNSVLEARRIEEDSLYSAKGHLIAAAFWAKFHLVIGIPTAVLAAIAGASALSQFDGNNIVAGSLSILVAGLASVTTLLNPNERENSHQNSGNRYNSLRNSARMFCEIDANMQQTDEDLVSKLRELANQRDQLNQDSAQIPGWAYSRALTAIRKGEAKYQVDNTE